MVRLNKDGYILLYCTETTAKLKELVKEVVQLEKVLKKRPKGFPQVWPMLNNHCKVPKYRLIKYADFEKAHKFLLKWRGGLRSGKSAPKKVKSWHTDRNKAIHAVINRFDLEPQYR